MSGGYAETVFQDKVVKALNEISKSLKTIAEKNDGPILLPEIKTALDTEQSLEAIPVEWMGKKAHSCYEAGFRELGSCIQWLINEWRMEGVK